MPNSTDVGKLDDFTDLGRLHGARIGTAHFQRAVNPPPMVVQLKTGSSVLFLGSSIGWSILTRRGHRPRKQWIGVFNRGDLPSWETLEHEAVDAYAQVLGPPLAGAVMGDLEVRIEQLQQLFKLGPELCEHTRPRFIHGPNGDA